MACNMDDDVFREFEETDQENINTTRRKDEQQDERIGGLESRQRDLSENQKDIAERLDGLNRRDYGMGILGLFGLGGLVGLAGLSGDRDEVPDRVGHEFVDSNYDLVESELGVIEEYARSLNFGGYSEDVAELGSDILNGINRYGSNKNHKLGFDPGENLIEYGISDEVLVSESLGDEAYDEVLDLYESI